MDLGPQDVGACPRAAMELYGRKFHPAEAVTRLLDRMYVQGDQFRPDAAAPLYEMFGYDHYRSVDYLDRRATWRVDLNCPTRLPETFDAITNFGTAEHVFNICAVFQFMHETLRIGGLGLHVMPTFGEVNHGFFNIHPTAFFDLATANGYVVEDYCFVDAIDVRTLIQVDNYLQELDFDQMPIRIEDLRDHFTVWKKILRQHDNVRQLVSGRFPPDKYTTPKDYSFVALRKITDAPFRYPVQSAYA